MSNSNSKASLFLMELIMSILFFSLSAAVCVQLFVKSHALSQQSLKLNYAVIASESLAECFYGTNGDPEEIIGVMEGSYLNASAKTIHVYYNKNFERISISDFPHECRYILTGVLREEDDMRILDITYVDYRDKEKVIYRITPELYVNKEETD